MTDQARLQDALLQALALPANDFTNHASLIHELVKPYLAQKAKQKLRGSVANSTGINREQDARLALTVLAVFVKLAGLTKSIPISIESLVDFIIVYTDSTSLKDDNRPSSPITSDHVSLAINVVSLLFRRKPSLARAIEKQVIPGYITLLSSSTDSFSKTWLEEALYTSNSLRSILKFNGIRESFVNSTEFWVAFQKNYDVKLPSLFSYSLSASPSLQELRESQNKLYLDLRFASTQLFSSLFKGFSIDTLLALLENEASLPDLPEILNSALPAVSLVNQSLLGDAEFYFGISEVLQSSAVVGIGQEEKRYVANGIKSTLPEGEPEDLLLILEKPTKGKGKAKATEEPTQPPSTENTLIAQVQSILLDSAPEVVARLLQASSLAGLSDENKIERVVDMILEGVADSERTTTSTKYHVPDTVPVGVEQTKPQVNGKSTFASVRRNIFDDRLDLSKVNFGKQDIMNDPILPSSLKESILQAVAQQQAEEEEEREYNEANSNVRTAAFLEDLGDGHDDDDDTGGSRVRSKVKDNVDSESEAEEEQERMHSRPAHSRPLSPQPSTTESSPLTQATEDMFLGLYIKDPALFAQTSRKSKERADLRNKTKLSNEQIEGWARILERNPRKARIIADAQEFKGNVRGSPLVATSDHKVKQDGKVGKDSSRPTGSGSDKEGRGGHTQSRGRGRGRGQSDQRRRGHDKKMAKAGV